MAKRKRARSERRRVERDGVGTERSVAPKQRQSARSKSGRSLPFAAIGWSLGGLAVVGLLIYALTAGELQRADAATEQLARLNAGTEVTVYSGRRHVVYHSDPPLPTASSPNVDGQPTLVWFSATWCEICERMSPFVHETASAYTERLHFVEKSVDHDRQAAGRYGVRGTPTFVMLNAAGQEVVRFHGQPNAQSFALAIEQALSAVAAG